MKKLCLLLLLLLLPALGQAEALPVLRLDTPVLDYVAVKPGRLTDAIGDARRTAVAIDQYLRGEKITPVLTKERIPAERLSKAYFEKCHHCDLPDA